MRARCFQFRYSVDYIDCECEAVSLVIDRQLHWRVDVAAFLVAPHVQVAMISPRVGQPVYQPWVAMEVEYDRLVRGKQAVEIPVTQPVWVLFVRLQLEQVNHIYEADFQIREFISEKSGGRECFLRSDIACASHHYIRFNSLIVAGRAPDTDASRAVRDRFIHGQVLKVRLLIADDDVDVVLAAQTMVGDRQQRINIWWQIYPRHLGSLVYDNVEKARVLMREAIVVLPPDSGCNQQVKRGHVLPPRKLITDRQPLRVLIEHRVNDMSECFVG